VGCTYLANCLGVLSEAAPSFLAAAAGVASASSVALAWRAFLRAFPGPLMDAVDFVRLRVDRAGGERGAAGVCDERRVGMMVVGEHSSCDCVT
jgi:hypothetical protein